MSNTIFIKEVGKTVEDMNKLNNNVSQTSQPSTYATDENFVNDNSVKKLKQLFSDHTGYFSYVNCLNSIIEEKYCHATKRFIYSELLNSKLFSELKKIWEKK